MNKYLLTLLINDKVSEKDRKELISSVTRNFGKVVKEDLWGSRYLSYPIKHNEKAFYAHFEFESEPNKISGLDKLLKLNEDIIRYLLIRA